MANPSSRCVEIQSDGEAKENGYDASVELRFEQVVPCPIDEVFAFHCDPKNLQLLMRDWPSFRLLHHDGGIHVGAQTWAEIKVGRIIPLVLGFVHTRLETPCCFSEELIHGMFQNVRHVHEFETASGGTRIRDTIRLTLPWYFGGEWGVRCLVVPGVCRLFDYRHASLLRLVREGRLKQE